MTKWCVKGGCDRWCVKDGVSRMVCDKAGCERVLKEGVSKMVCQRCCVTESFVKDGV